MGETITMHAKIKAFEPLESLVFGYGIKDRLGQLMYGTNTWHTGQVLLDVDKDSEYEIKITFPANLGEGSYSIQAALHDSVCHLSQNYEWIEFALMFNVINIGKKVFLGGCFIEPEIIVENLQETASIK